MLTISPVISAATFMFNASELPKDKNVPWVKKDITTEKIDVPLSDGLEWWIGWRPDASYESERGHISVFLYVNKPVKATYTFAVSNSGISETITNHEFIDSPLGFGWAKVVSHKNFRSLSRDGRLTVTCNVKFTSSIMSIPIAPAVYQVLEQQPDFDLVVQSKRLKIHKKYFEVISTYFGGMFSHKFRESETGEVKMSDFDYDTVKTAVDYCYGRELKLLCAETYVDVLRFADKCGIDFMIKNWESLIPLNLSKTTFCYFLKYADDFGKDALLTECYTYFKDHQDEVISSKQFEKLPIELVIRLLKSAFDLKTDFDVLRHAHKHEIDFITDYFELPLVLTLSLENFSSTVSYAWDCSSENLKEACAKYLHDNRYEVTTNTNFLNLPGDIICDVLKFASII